MLAVIDREISRWDGIESYSDGKELIAARAALAELLRREAIMREVLDDLAAQCVSNLEVGATGPGYWTDAHETITAALARCGGAK